MVIAFLTRQRRNYRRWTPLTGRLLLLAALAGCQPDQPKGQPNQSAVPPPAPPIAEAHPVELAVTVPADTLPPPAPEPAQLPDAESYESTWRSLGSPDVRRILQVHRYVGTVGGQPVTAELQWYTPDSITGRFFLHRGSTGYSLHHPQKRTDPGRLDVTAEGYPEESAQGHWRLVGRPGHAALRATWSNGPRQQAVVLQESYAGAVRYGLRNRLVVEANRSVLCNFLVLPIPATVRPSLRPVLNPGPKARRRQLQDLEEGNAVVTHQLSVRLNSFGLFSYQTTDYSHETGGTSSVGFESTLLDLTNGRPITVDSQLQPGYELPLQRLLTRHFLHDSKFDHNRERLANDWENPQLADFPDMDLGLTETGLEAVYWQPMYPESVVIPFAELRPLVRPGTPLARMLWARGLW